MVEEYNTRESNPSKGEFGFLPMLSLLSDNKDNLCGILCEMFVLYHRRIPYDQNVLLATAKKRNWLKPEGTPLFCLGNLLANEGLYVTRQYHSTLKDIQDSLKLKHDIIVGVNCKKLYIDKAFDVSLTNHAVVVTHEEKETLTILDPQTVPYIIKVSKTDFLNAWKDLHCYMIRVLQSVEEYKPHPVCVDNIPLNEELKELQEAIAENAHEVWALSRIKEGWRYGRLRDDGFKEHPDLVPYLDLPESEKEYDRKLAFETIKLVEKLGFKITKI